MLLGGLLTSALGWESVFFVNVPLAGAAALLAFALIPADPPVERGRSFDLPGALSVTAGVTLVVFALVRGPALGWASPVVVAAATAGLAVIRDCSPSSSAAARIRCSRPGCSPIATSPRPSRSPSSSGARSARCSTS